MNTTEDITKNLIEIIKNETSAKLQKEEDLNKRTRLFILVLYPDSTSYDFEEVMRNIKSYKKWAYALHDKDIKEESQELKKIHYHIIIKTDNATTISALSKKLGINDNYIEKVRNERSMIRYLIHLDDTDKFHYEKDIIKSSKLYSRFVQKCFDDLEDEPTQLSNIYSFITDLKDKEKSIHNATFLLIQYVNMNCYDTIYKRYRYEIQDYLKSIYY